MAVKKKQAKKVAPKRKSPTKDTSPSQGKRDEYGLLPKEREVADLYRAGPDDIRGNAKRCYKRVHPRVSEATAETEGPATLRKTQVRQYLDAMTKKVSEAADISQERILRDLSLLADMCLGRTTMPKTLVINEAMVDKEIKEVNPAGAARALELLGKTHKMFIDKTENDTTVRNESIIDPDLLDAKERATLRRIIEKGTRQS